MSYDLNRVVLSGRLCFPPEHRTLASGQELTTFRLAFPRHRRRPDGEGFDELASFVTVKTWSGTARVAAERLSKGDRVVVDGRLEFESWKDASGRERSVHTVLAERVLFVDLKRSSEGRSSEGRSPEGRSSEGREGDEPARGGEKEDEALPAEAMPF